MSDLNLQKFKEALASLKFPSPRQKTFLEIIDLHRIESVSSKVLAYLLDSEANHGLGNLGLLALIRAAKIKNKRIPKSLKVSTEYPCDGNKGRIDIVVEMQDQLIIIENKIAHSLNNPFDLYVRQCSKDFRHINPDQRLYILMGNHLPKNLPKPFMFVSHSDFGKALVSLMHKNENTLLQDNYYSTFILDYITAMESMNKKSVSTEEQNLLEFCVDNYEILELLDSQREVIRQHAKKMLIETIEHLDATIAGNLFPSSNLKLYKSDYWRWLGAYSISIPIKTKGIRYDIYLSIEWYLKDAYVVIEFWKRSPEYQVASDDVINMLKDKGFKNIMLNERNEVTLYQHPTKNLNVEKFAKEISKIHNRIMQEIV